MGRACPVEGGAILLRYGFRAVESTPAFGKAFLFAGRRWNGCLGHFLRPEGPNPAPRSKTRRRQKARGARELTEEGGRSCAFLRQQAARCGPPSLWANRHVQSSVSVQRSSSQAASGVWRRPQAASCSSVGFQIRTEWRAATPLDGCGRAVHGPRALGGSPSRGGDRRVPRREPGRVSWIACISASRQRNRRESGVRGRVRTSETVAEVVEWRLIQRSAALASREKGGRRSGVDGDLVSGNSVRGESGGSRLGNEGATKGRAVAETSRERRRNRQRPTRVRGCLSAMEDTSGRRTCSPSRGAREAILAAG